MYGISEVKQWLIEAQKVTVLTGAGISAESSIPTFRSTPDPDDPDLGESAETMRALWAEFDPQTLATPEAYAADPERVSRWYDWRRVKCLRAEPNPGHLALATLEQQITGRGGTLTILTQNVDGLHQRAGSRNVVELHGSIHTWHGVRTGQAFPLTNDGFERFPPRCEDGEIARPGVVWFGEALPDAALAAAEAAMDGCDFFITVGTSALVYPAAGFIQAAQQLGARTVEVNPEETAASEVCDAVLRGPSGEMLPQLVG